jgi:hypothetical protein
MKADTDGLLDGAEDQTRNEWILMRGHAGTPNLNVVKRLMCSGSQIGRLALPGKCFPGAFWEAAS